MKRFFAKRPVLRIALELTALVLALVVVCDAVTMLLAAQPDALTGSSSLRQLLLPLLFAAAALPAIFFYLRRMLATLARLPGLATATGAIPPGVKIALDTLTPGVLLLAPRGDILYANRAFRAMSPDAEQEVEGRGIATLGWFTAHIDAAAGEYPWETVVRTNLAMLRKSIMIKRDNGKSQELIMNCSSINDEHGISRGAIVSFDDVTLLSNSKAAIVQAMKNLKLSDEQIQRQNTELQRHANLDAMTGCLNRRAFFSIAEPLFQKIKQSNGILYCIMADIDHFKLVNDRHGHSVGDLVIQQVSSTIHRSLRGKDLFCRYGGEEFVLLLDGGEPNGMAVAERLRERIEREGGLGVRSVAGLRITSSFGVAAIGGGATVETLKELIDLADAALYESKRKGRNQVTYAQDGLQIADGTN